MKKANQLDAKVVEDYDASGNAPMRWLLSAHELIAAANICFRRFKTNEDRKEARRRRLHFYPELGIGVLLMLYAFALEALLKSLLLARGERAAVSGLVSRSFLTHNLVNLCERAHIQAANGDETRLIEHMTRAVQFGRYPIASSAATARGLMLRVPEDYPTIHDILARVQESILAIEPFTRLAAVDMRLLGVRRIPIALSRRRRANRKTLPAKDSGGRRPS